MFEFFGVGTLVVVGFILIWIWNSLYIIKEWERGVVLRLGRMLPEAKGAGVNIVIWPIEVLTRMSLRIETLDVPPQDIITRDNISVKVNAVCVSLNWKRAVPNEAGRAAPVVVVGTVGGTSCELVMLTTKSLTCDGESPAEASRLSTY